LVDVPSTDGGKTLAQLAAQVAEFKARAEQERTPDNEFQFYQAEQFWQREQQKENEGIAFQQNLDAFITRHWSSTSANPAQLREYLINCYIVARTGKMREDSDKNGPLLMRVDDKATILSRSECAVRAKRSKAAGRSFESYLWRHHAPAEGRPIDHSKHHVVTRLHEIDRIANRGKNYGQKSGRGSRFTRIVVDFYETFLPDFEDGHRVFPPPSQRIIQGF
jgi:hypothetical protein